MTLKSRFPLTVQILSVNIGDRRLVTIKHRQVETGIYKLPASGRVPVNRFGLQDDVRVEPRKMGLENHAIYVYPREHYAYWEHELERTPFPMGQFGENLTVTGLLEGEVRIGDIFRFGDTVLQVAQPRIPCAKLNERMGMRFSSMFLASHKVGFYLRVLQEGSVAQGDSIELLERDENSPTIEAFVRITQHEYWDAESLQQLLQARDLMPAWREVIEDKIRRAQADSGWPGLRELEVLRRERESEDTVSLYLRCARGRPLPPFQGGQLITVVMDRHTPQQHRRAYALSGNPRDLSAYRITVRQMAAPDISLPAGIVSSHLFGMQAGDRIMCTSPTGSIALLEQAERGRTPVLLSQGLGIAPTLSLMYELEARKVSELYLIHEQTAGEPQDLLREAHALVKRHNGWKLAIVKPGLPEQDALERVRHLTPLDRAVFHIAGSRSFCENLSAGLKSAGVAHAALTLQAFN